MARRNFPQTNPNTLLGCHPANPETPIQGRYHPWIKFGNPDLTSSASIHRPSKKTVFDRLAPKRFLGKPHVINFLYSKRQQGCTDDTLSSYGYILTGFLTYAQKLGRTNLDQLIHDDLEGYVESEQDRGLKPATIRLHLVSIYCFVRYLVDQEILPPERFARKIKIKCPDALPKAMESMDVKRLLDVIDHVRDRAMIVVLLRTGMRIGELLNLKMDDVRLLENKILIWEGEKNRIGRSVLISDDAHRALSRWIDHRDPGIEHLFYARGRRTISYASSRNIMIKYLEMAGLAGKGYTLHSLRHTFATELLNAGMRLECLQQLLGHSNLEMTLRYARLSDQTREQEYFKAMKIIEGDFKHGPDPFDRPLPSPFETPESVAPHHQELS